MEGEMIQITGIHVAVQIGVTCDNHAFTTGKVQPDIDVVCVNVRLRIQIVFGVIVLDSTDQKKVA